jgi:hypothetical protein
VPGWAAPSAALAAAAVVLGGCAERQLVAGPAAPPSGLTWAAVWAAAALASVVAGALLTLPAWRGGGGSRIAVAVLTLQTGAAFVTAAVLAGMAVRSWQLIERPATEMPVPALVRLSAIDGDTGFFALMVLVVVVLGSGLTALLALATRLAAGTTSLERLGACVVLAIEVGACAFGAARFALGGRWWPYQAASLALAPLVLALVACWPGRQSKPLRPAGTLAP